MSDSRIGDAFSPDQSPRFPSLHRSEAMYEAGRREVDLYVRTYTTQLRSSGSIHVDALVPAHLNIESSLHTGASEATPDMNAFMYSTLRLPPEITSVHQIVIGQSVAGFVRAGFQNPETWQAVTAPGRRRKWHYDGKDTLAVYVGSPSDLDDLIPTIVAWQIEWNKMHRLIRSDPQLEQLILAMGTSELENVSEVDEAIRHQLGIEPYDWQRLQAAWSDQFWPTMLRLQAAKRDIQLRMLGGSYLGYARSVAHWWSPVAKLLASQNYLDRPVYFVSSNTHSIVNILSGTAGRRRDRIVRYIEDGNHPELVPELKKLQSGDVEASWDNFLYYAARLYYRDFPEERIVRDQEEAERGIITLHTDSVLDIAIQIIDLNQLHLDDIDPRIRKAAASIAETDAIILNINYPLGLAAHNIISEVAITLEQLEGVYVLGKAATLNARIGDVMISDVVYDEHSENVYWFNNIFSSADIERYLAYGSALDHQRAISVKGTYLQNRGHLDFYYQENYTVAEMEAGPYLSALSVLYGESFIYDYRRGDTVNLDQLPLDLGIIHYASDTPYTRAQTLGARGLSYYGMDSTYASTLAIVRRICEQCSA